MNKSSIVCNFFEVIQHDAELFGPILSLIHSYCLLLLKIMLGGKLGGWLGDGANRVAGSGGTMRR